MPVSLKNKLTLISAIICLLSCLPLFYFGTLSLVQTLFIFAIFLFLSIAITRYFANQIDMGIRALETGLLNLKDGEFSTSLAHDANDEFAYLCQLFNETSDKLRAEKQWLYQRELLLDKITQTTPHVLLLVNDRDQIVFSNYSARAFFASSTKLEGNTLSELIKHSNNEIIHVMQNQNEGLFTLQEDSNESQTWHMSFGHFNLNNQPHKLYILKQMTRELSRQEVAVWKKVIRVISHELNNSLGPISSMLHSGKILTQDNSDNRLNRVFSTIEDRIQHLNEFVQGYGKFAKLPEPKRQQVSLLNSINLLRQQWAFHFESDQEYVYADPVQLEQLLINLIKNAHESGSPANEITLKVTAQGSNTVIEVNDRGQGMAEGVINNALIPFYSTKQFGSGLGLALCREITDAHHGKILLQNRNKGGVSVRVYLPLLNSKE